MNQEPPVACDGEDVRKIRAEYPSVRIVHFESTVKTIRFFYGGADSGPVLGFNVVQDSFFVSIRGSMMYKVESENRVLRLSDQLYLQGGVKELFERIINPVLSDNKKKQ